MKLDLHCHSTFSDGSLPAREVAERARRQCVEIFCLTDHDTFAGYETTREVFDEQTTVLRGTELSCKQDGRTIHLLVYGAREGPELDRLNARLLGVQLDRRDRITLICKKLQALGHAIEPEPILAAAEGRTAGRPDVARALVAAGVCTSFGEAFHRFLHDGGPADVQIESLSLGDGLALALATGAKTSIAHPHSIGPFPVVEAYLQTHRPDGLDGLEAYYGRYDKGKREPWLRLARKYDMVVTGGSDFHGEAMPEVSRPGIEMPPDLADSLRNWFGVQSP